MTSVAVSPDGRRLAVAVQAADYDAAGSVALFACRSDGSLKPLSTVRVGVQPDMLTFADNSTILTADEGEPRKGIDGIDPKGSVTIVTIDPDTAEMTAESVYFDAFDARRDALTAAGVLVQKGAAPSTDFEPEYIAVSDGKAYVSLQEANAVAVLDLHTKQFKDVYPLGFQDYGTTKIDLQNNGKIELKTYENVYGIKMPDGIAVTDIGGKTYLLTANEGDSRADWNGMNNESKDKSSPTGGVKLDKKVTWFDAAKWDGTDPNRAYVFGGRSFSLYEIGADGLTLLYDSGSDFEEITAEKLPDVFNCSNDAVEADDRSGKKGPEPESVTVGTVGGRIYAFIALERIGGVMVYDITRPTDVRFVNYINSRDFSGDIVGDVSPEGLCFVPAASSGQAMLLAACEVSGTLAAYALTPVRSSTSGGSSSGGSSSGGSSAGKPSTDKPSTDKPSTEDPSPTVPEQEDAIPFKDVPKDAYFFDAVAWAVRKQLTSGVSAAEFAPEAACTRAQIVTLLWRAAGSPATKNGRDFSDVPADSYYADAVAWAVENGIVVGMGDGRFAPDATCTRAQAVTLLYRALNGQSGSTADFSDVPADSYYADAVGWAAANGVVGGIGQNLFGPENNCTRAQIVTLLYRAAA